VKRQSLSSRDASTSGHVHYYGKYSGEYFATTATSGDRAGAFSPLERGERQMRTSWILIMAVIAMSVTAAAGAQSTTAMGKPAKGDTMTMTYTGCVESANHGSWFLLTKVDGSGTMHRDTAMKHPMADDKMDAMAAKSFALAGAMNFSKHVGQSVSVTGSVSDGSTGAMRQGVSTLTVKSLKVIAKSCS
jgi:hypothetical protein